MSDKVRIGIIGAGAVSDYHHVPGIRIDSRCELVSVCDPNEALLEQRQKDWGPTKKTTNYEEVARDPDVDAVIVATPNFTHLPISLACIEHGKHVMCEKPLGLNYHESLQMYHAARDKGVRHMTAFTYRFAPSMRYVRHLVKTGAFGAPGIFAASGFWNGLKRAGAGGNTKRPPGPGICST